ncbi:MAG: hypothetical protein COB50_01025 [Thiotrichales bacterium]|nr:MAG: hypothetical protein COB50_01025 [Thiotrichales bacterium]
MHYASADNKFDIADIFIQCIDEKTLTITEEDKVSMGEYQLHKKKYNLQKKLKQLLIFILGLSICAFNFICLKPFIFNNAKQAIPLLVGGMLGACCIAYDFYKVLHPNTKSHFKRNLLLFMLKLSLSIGAAVAALLLVPIAATSGAAALTGTVIASNAYAATSTVEMVIKGLKGCCTKDVVSPNS